MTHHDRVTLTIQVFMMAIAGCLIALPLLVPVPAERWALVAYATDGSVWIAGSGGTCAAAFTGAVYPKDWRELRCERVRP